MCFMQWKSGGLVQVKTYFEVDRQVGGGLVPGGGEVQPQLLNGAHGRSGEGGRPQRWRITQRATLTMRDSYHIIEVDPTCFIYYGD